jgi:hypothetical protein
LVNGTPDEPMHQPLTTEERWTAAQTEPRGKRQSGEYPLTHIATCTKCDSGLVGALQTVRGNTYRRMRCSNPDCRGGTSISAERLEEHVKAGLKELLGDKKARASFAPDGLDEARDALEQAKADRARWAADDRARDLMGDEAWYAGLEDRAHKVQRAQAHYQVIASQAARVERLPYPNELDDPDQFVRALRAGVKRVPVRPGRGTIGERVPAIGVLLNGDVVAWPLAA